MEIDAQARRFAEYPDEVPALIDSVHRRLSWRKRHGRKRCYRCGEEKVPTEFGIDSRERDGLARICRACRHVS